METSLSVTAEPKNTWKGTFPEGFHASQGISPLDGEVGASQNDF